jgi:hypothetical protein
MAKLKAFLVLRVVANFGFSETIGWQKRDSKTTYLSFYFCVNEWNRQRNLGLCYDDINRLMMFLRVFLRVLTLKGGYGCTSRNAIWDLLSCYKAQIITIRFEYRVGVSGVCKAGTDRLNRLLYHPHQPIAVPTAGAQAFIINIRRTGHNPPRGPSADWWVK